MHTAKKTAEGPRSPAAGPEQTHGQGIDRRDFLTSAALAATAALMPGCGGARPQAQAGDLGTASGGGGGLSAAFDRFGVTEASVRKVMARALEGGGAWCDLYFERKTTHHLSLEDHAVNRATSTSEIGLGVRVVRGVETGYAYTESLDLPSMLEAAAAAASVSKGAARAVPAAFRVGRLPSLYPVKTPWPAVGTAQKVRLLTGMHDRVTRRDKRIAKVNIHYSDQDAEILIVDSLGRVVSDPQPMTVCYVSCMAEDKGRKESNYSARAGRSGLEFFDEATIEAMTREAVERTVVLFDAVEGPVGELPVVLAPGSSGILLHEAIGHGMEADFARNNTTIYSDKVGKRIAPEYVTIVDDGTNPGLRGSINVDDEGERSQRTVLVEGGVLRTFMHDRISAQHFGLEPTGNGRRESFRHMPVPRMRNTYMLAGPHKPADIIASIKKGIYAEHFTNGQVNIGAGDFTFYVKNGMLIEDGVLTRPIKDVNIIGNGPEVLERVTMVGDDFKLDHGGWTCGKRGQGVPVGLGMPTVAIAAVTIGGTGKGAAGKPAKAVSTRSKKG